jgi:hypothetical protein
MASTSDDDISGLRIESDEKDSKDTSIEGNCWIFDTPLFWILRPSAAPNDLFLDRLIDSESPDETRFLYGETTSFVNSVPTEQALSKEGMSVKWASFRNCIKSLDLIACF